VDSPSLGRSRDERLSVRCVERDRLQSLFEPKFPFEALQRSPYDGCLLGISWDTGQKRSRHPIVSAFMANREHLRTLFRGPKAWNTWRSLTPRSKPDLSGADLRGVALKNANLRDANLSGTVLIDADLSGANLTKSRLADADLRESILLGAVLYSATLRNADLRGAFLRWADLSRADFTNAKLQEADLRRTHLARTVFRGANLSGCSVYGSAVWNVDLEGAIQHNIVVTEDNEPRITVDDLEIAQFVYLILNNQKLRNIIDTVSSKAVLLLGRFTLARKQVLEALRAELRHRGYLPILFDFQGPLARNLTETVSTLAHLARFVIADITDAKSIPQELARIVPSLPSLPVQPILMASSKKYAMFDDFSDYPWVLPLYRYKNIAHLLQSVADSVIAPAEKKVQQILDRHDELRSNTASRPTTGRAPRLTA